MAVLGAQTVDRSKGKGILYSNRVVCCGPNRFSVDFFTEDKRFSV